MNLFLMTFKNSDGIMLFSGDLKCQQLSMESFKDQDMFCKVDTNKWMCFDKDGTANVEATLLLRKYLNV